MVQAVLDYVEDAPLRARHGAAGRARIECELSLARMVERYRGLYRQLACSGATAARLHARPDSTE
jgi:glycosyltransferase involved in cell wall biosynthesis